MEENHKEEEERIIMKKLRYYGKYSRKTDPIREKQYNENRFYGFRLGDIKEIKYDINGNPILTNEDGTKLIDSFSNNEDEEEENNIDIDINSENFYNKKTNKNHLGRKRNNKNYNESNISEEEITNNNDYRNNVNNHNKKKENNNKNNKEKCPICNFTFFENMDLNEKNEHINACLDGHGEENIEQLKKTYEILEYHTNLELEQDPNCCPYCHKIFKKNIKQHQRACIRRFEQDN